MIEILRPARFPISEPGFYDMEAVRYHGDPCHLSLNSSVAHILATKSPLHAQYAHPRLRPADAPPPESPKPEMSFGSLVHALVLGGGQEVAVCEYDDWRTKAAREFRDAAIDERKIPILAKDYEAVEVVAASVKRQISQSSFAHVLQHGHPELTGIWREDDVWFRMRMDCIHVTPKEVIIFDLKTTMDGAPLSLGRKMLDYGYHTQAAFYSRGVQAILPQAAGRIRFIFAFVEKTCPYAVTLAELDGSGEAIGQANVAKAIDLWRECNRTGIWPGYPQDVVIVETPVWAVRQMMIEEMNAA